MWMLTATQGGSALSTDGSTHGLARQRSGRGSFDLGRPGPLDRTSSLNEAKVGCCGGALHWTRHGRHSQQHPFSLDGVIACWMLFVLVCWSRAGRVVLA